MLFRGILSLRLGGGEARRTSAAIIGYHFTDSKQQVIRRARTRTASTSARQTQAVGAPVSRVQVARSLTRVASLSWQRWRSSGKGGNPRMIRQRAWGDARLPYSRDTPTIIATFPPLHTAHPHALSTAQTTLMHARAARRENGRQASEWEAQKTGRTCKICAVAASPGVFRLKLIGRPDNVGLVG